MGCFVLLSLSFWMFDSVTVCPSILPGNNSKFYVYHNHTSTFYDRFQNTLHDTQTNCYAFRGGFRSSVDSGSSLLCFALNRGHACLQPPLERIVADGLPLLTFLPSSSLTGTLPWEQEIKYHHPLYIPRLDTASTGKPEAFQTSLSKYSVFVFIDWVSARR